jgi:cell division protein FtsQ
MAAAANRRRQQKPQTLPKRRFGLITLAAGVACLASAGVLAYDYLLQPGRLPLRVVEINGDFQQLEPQQVEWTVMDAIDGGFFSCDMQRLRTAVLALPWVDDVSIRRVWPDRLRMTVTEQVPLARWGDDALINVSGGVFWPGDLEGYAGLVQLRGPEGSERHVVDFFQAALPAARMRELQISAVELDERRHWWMRFEGGLVLSLGNEDINYRLAQFFRVYPSLVSEAGRLPARVDMRYAHGFAVRWREPANDEGGAADMTSQEKV